jgi:hypothetical protein
MSVKKNQWSEQEKALLAKSVLIAQKHNKALTSVFDIVAEDIERPSSAVGMFYYNHFRGDEMDKGEYAFTEEEEKMLLKRMEGTRDYVVWTEEEKDLVRLAAEEALKNNKPLTDAWKEIKPLMPHRSISSIAAFYYREIKPSDVEEEAKKTEVVEGEIEEYNFEIETLQENTPAVENIINALIGLANNEQAYRLTKMKLEEVMVENKELQTKLTELQEEYDSLTDRLRHIEEQYENAQGLFNTFVSMASISQIMGLGDFKEQMKTTIDKWGNVLKIETSASRAV